MSAKVKTLDDFLALFPDKRSKAGHGWLVICPAHDDHTPSLWVKPSQNPDFIADWKCQAGCTNEAVLTAMHLTWADVRRNGRDSARGDSGNGEACQPVNGGSKHVRNGVDTPTPNCVNCVTLAALAEAKRLPVDFLKSLGISDFKYCGQSSVKIPYYSEDGSEISVRFRLALSGDSRFKWRKGDHAMPYGLNRLGQIKKAGWVLIVEGESDLWTGWYHGIPTLGAPGKGIWPVSWGEYLKGLRVYVWQEPNAEDFVVRLLRSTPALQYIRAPDGIKDISEAHIQGLNIPAWLEELKAKAESGQELKARYDDERLAQLYKEAATVIQAEDPLDFVEDAIRGLGYGGDLNPALIAYIAATSRLLTMREGSMPVHLLLTGPSSSGKSYTLSLIKKLLPEAAHYTVDAGSPRTVIYNDAELQHRLLVYSEADSLASGEDNPAASAIRNLLQDHHLHYEVTVRDPDTGDFTVRKVEKPGPTVLITTSTRPLGAQLMTRLFSLEVGDSKEQIGAALETQAALEIEGAHPLDGALVAFQGYLQLKAPLNVIVPFAGELARAMSKTASAPRILRDFARLLSLVKAVALIRHYRRQTDEQGRIIATIEDYETVKALVGDMYIDSSTGASRAVRALVEAVRTLDADKGNDERITNTTLAKYVGIGVKQITRQAHRAIKQGWLVNREQRKSYPADYALGEPMPETEGLPVLTGLAGLTPVDRGVSTEIEANNKRVDRLTALTDDDTPPNIPTKVTPATNAAMTLIDPEWRVKVLQVWKSEGKPVIHLGIGENCLDLTKLLSNPCNERQIEAVKAWLQGVSR